MDTQTLPPAQATRGSRRKLETRAKLLAAARTLFVEKGYHATRPQDIARLADVGHGTFYLQFEDKRACFLAFVAEARAELRAYVRQEMAGADGWERQIRTLVTALLDFTTANPGVIKAAMMDLSVIEPSDAPADTLPDLWAETWARRLTRGMAAGEIDDRYDPAIAARMIVGVLSGAVRAGMRSPSRRKSAVEDATRFLMRALAPRTPVRGDRRTAPKTARRRRMPDLEGGTA